MAAFSDQAVLVHMGMANQFKLRVAGPGRSVTSVEQMERWGVAMGMALQEEQGRVDELSAEVESLKASIQDKDRQIDELESGL